MYTSADKAWTALLLGVLSLLNIVWGIDWFGAQTEGLIGVIIAILFPIAVYVVPNR